MALTRHAICHGCTDIIRVKYFLWVVSFCSEHTVFAENSAFVAFYGLLVTHLVAHRFTFGNPVLAICIIYLLDPIGSQYIRGFVTHYIYIYIYSCMK